MKFTSLLSKGMVAITALVVVQIALFLVLAGLQLDLKHSTENARRSTLIGNNLSQTYKWIAEMIKVRNTPELVEDFPKMRQRLLALFAELRGLLTPKEQEQLQLAQLEADSNEIFYWLKGVNTQEEIDRMVKIGARIMERYDKFIELSEREDLKASQIAKHQQNARDASSIIIKIGIVMQVLLLVCISLWMRYDISTRLAALKENLTLFAEQKALHPRVGGKDEIARLDSAFHKMVESVNDAANKKKAIFDNASDVICRVDEKQNVLAVNKACETVLGYEPKDLIGKNIEYIILDDDRARMRKQFAEVAGAKGADEKGAKEKGHQQEQFEVRVRRKNTSVVETLWSVQWSEAERSSFCVVHDITVRKQADRLRQEILQMVSHDLRTPLATVSGFFEMAEEGFVGKLSAEGMKDVSGCLTASASMVELIRNLLDIEKIEAGMLELDRKNLPLIELFVQAVGAVISDAEERSVKIHAPEDAVWNVYVDEDRCVQALTTLLKEAINSSPPGLSVILDACTMGDDFIEIQVVDHGQLVSDELRQMIFDPFAQMSLPGHKQARGSGMGLAVCKALIELHGGAISFTSQEGANKFVFTLPTKPSLPLSDG